MFKLFPVNPEFRDWLFERYPKLREDEDAYSLFRVLLITSSKRTVPLSHSYISQLLGSPRVNVGKLLARYKESFPEFSWTSYSKADGRARQVKTRGIPEEVYEAARRLNTKSRCTRDLFSGKAINEDNISVAYASARTRAQAYSHRFERGTRIIRYLNSQPVTAFSRLSRTNAEAMESALEEWEEKVSAGKTGRDLAEIVATRARYTTVALTSACQPFYRATENVDRIYPTEDCILSLPRTVREAFFRGHLQIDLRHAQWSIAAATWCQELEDVENPWQELLGERYGNRDAKAAAKTALYSLFYGASTATVKKSWDYPDWDVNDFLAVPLIKTILSARQTAQALLEDTYQDQSHKVMARLAQDAEFDIMTAAYDVAFEHPKLFTIRAHIHDGIIIKPAHNRDIDLITALINNAVGQRARLISADIQKRFNIEPLSRAPIRMSVEAELL